jgi:hypothetical protein
MDPFLKEIGLSLKFFSLCKGYGLVIGPDAKLSMKDIYTFRLFFVIVCYFTDNNNLDGNPFFRDRVVDQFRKV